MHGVAHVAGTVRAVERTEGACCLTHLYVYTSTTVSVMEITDSKWAHTVALLGTSALVEPMPLTFRKIVWPVLRFSPLAETMGIFSQSIPRANVLLV